MVNATDRGSLQLYRRLLGYVFPYKGIFAVAVVAMAIGAAMDASFAALIKEITDRGLVEPDAEFIKLIPWLIVGVILVKSTAGFIGSYCMSWVGRQVVFDLRQLVFNKLIRLSSSFYDDHSSALLVSKLIYDVERTASATTDALTLITKDAFTTVALVAWLLYLDWKLTLVFFIFAPLITIAVRIAARRFRKTSERIQSSIGSISHVAKEAIIGERIVKTYGGQSFEKHNFLRANQRNRRQELKRAVVSAAMAPSITLMVGLPIAVIISLAVGRTGPDAFTAGAFTSYLATVVLLMSPLKRLAKVNEKIQMGIAAANSVFRVADEPQELDTGTETLDHPRGRIEYKDVHFLYDRSNLPVLKDLSFTIEPGQTVALVGASGSGKSTITALLLGFYRPTQGVITIDGIDHREIQLNSLRQNMAIVAQDTILFDETIRNNIIYGYEGEVSDKRLRRAVEAAHVAEFTDALPKGLDTYVGEQGLRLSGGQRQRIAIARALFKDAPILIFDEATSSLDAVSERLVKDATESLLHDRTTLIIAHRLSTIESADRILVLDKGQIVEQGQHNDLFELGGIYTRLYRSQIREQRLAG
ncbi:MAG: lipid A export permease/ATP-binding protein MsbA [Arenicellales bacterium]|nr:lipid A export permease/ATP-binding protein MsbA [Arenicellales bacterium]